MFVLQEIIVTGPPWLALLFSSLVMNAVPEMFGPQDHRLHMTFMNWSFPGIQESVVVMPGFAILFCLYHANQARGLTA